MKYYKDGKEVKRANTIKQRLKLLNTYTNNKYTIIENAYYGYAIFENGIKIFDTLNQFYYQSMLGKICINNKLIDDYSNILVNNFKVIYILI